MVVMVFLARARMSPPHDGIHRWPQAHRTGGSLGISWGTQLVPIGGGTYRVGTRSSPGRRSQSTPAPEEFGAPSGLGGFRGYCAVASALGVGGLVAFGDSSLTLALFVEESGLMS
jgi:hypothetical protein